MMKGVLVALGAAVIAVALAGPTDAAPMRLRFGVADAANSPLVKEIYVPWAKRVTDASGGEVEVEVVPGGTLGNFAVIYDRVVANVANLGAVLTNYNAGQFPKSSVFSIPFEVNNAAEASIAFWRLYKQGLLGDEYAQVVPLYMIAFTPQRALSRTPITKPADMKGLKIAVAGKMRSDTASLLGAAPVSMKINEVYQGLSTGVVDGSFNPIYGVLQFHMDEVASNLFYGSFGSSTMAIVMNKDVWNKLSDKAKKAFTDNSGEKMSRDWGEWLDSKDAQILKALEGKKGFKIVVPTAEQREEWRVLLQPLGSQWAKDTPNGQKVLDALRDTKAQIASGK
jgi:TRAP-type C4-dicarboxylate transport system substrate-binding protein